MNPATIAKLSQLQKTYVPSAETRAEIGNKTLVMFVAPSAMGKTTIENALVELNPAQIGRTRSFVTRAPRPNDDPNLYEFISPEKVSQIVNDIANRRVVQFAIHPTTGDIYGTYPHSFPAKINLLDTLSQVVEPLRKTFAQTLTIGLVTNPEIWLSRLRERYAGDPKTFIKRLNEARISVSWQLNQHPNDVFLLQNIEGNYAQTAENAMEFIDGTPIDQLIQNENRQMLRKCLQLIKEVA